MGYIKGEYIYIFPSSWFCLCRALTSTLPVLAHTVVAAKATCPKPFRFAAPLSVRVLSFLSLFPSFLSFSPFLSLSLLELTLSDYKSNICFLWRV